MEVALGPDERGVGALAGAAASRRDDARDRKLRSAAAPLRTAARRRAGRPAAAAPLRHLPERAGTATSCCSTGSPCFSRSLRQRVPVEPLLVGGMSALLRWYPRLGLRPVPQLESDRRARRRSGRRQGLDLCRMAGRRRRHAPRPFSATRAESARHPPRRPAGGCGPLGQEGLAALRERALELAEVEGAPLVLDPADELLFTCAMGARTVPVQTCQWLVGRLPTASLARGPGARPRCSSGRAGSISSRRSVRRCTTSSRSPATKFWRLRRRRSTPSPSSRGIVLLSPSPAWEGPAGGERPRFWPPTCRPRPTTRRFAPWRAFPGTCRSAGESKSLAGVPVLALRKALAL